MKAPFVPHNINKIQIQWTDLLPFIIDANKYVAKYDAFLFNIINPELLLTPLLTKEAVYSSRIEGTHVTIEDVMMQEGGAFVSEPNSVYYSDVQETINYKNALLYGTEMLSYRKLSLSMIKEFQKILLSGVRGSKKLLGEFRKRQVWIGMPGSTIENARFIPPDPIIVPEHLEKLEKFIQKPYKDIIVQLAIFHAQFEIIHPFEDGNGRVGRLLIPLFLFWKKVLTKPNFYLSEYLENNRKEYYDKLLAITENNDWNGWIEYFLKAVAIQAKINIDKAKKIIDLYDKAKNDFIKITKSQYAVPLLDAFFIKPVISGPELIDRSRVASKGNFFNIMQTLLEAKIVSVVQEGKGRLPTLYRFDNLYNLLATL